MHVKHTRSGWPEGVHEFSHAHRCHAQVWHMDAYVNLPSGSRPEYHTLQGHSSSIYALVVTERQLISAAHDKLIKMWDLNTKLLIRQLYMHSGKMVQVALQELIMNASCAVRPRVCLRWPTHPRPSASQVLWAKV